MDVREELRYAERKAQFYLRESHATIHETWKLTLIGMHHHYMGRRRWLLKQLLKKQLKEFDYEEAS